MPDASHQPDHVPSWRGPPAAHAAGAADSPNTDRPASCIRLAGFLLTSWSEGGMERISIAGELAGTTALLLEVETLELCRLRGGTTIDLVLDLTEVTFLDATGVTTLRRVSDRALLQGRLRLGLPVADRPSRMLALAVNVGLLPPVFGPHTPIL
jgi:hypothetical protein